MTHICVTTEVNSWVEEGPDDDYLKGEPYSYRGATGGRVSNVIAFVVDEPQHYYGDSHGKDLDVGPGDTVYAVVAGYTTGDTFGREGGQAKVLDFFTDPDKANRLCAVAQDTVDYSFNFEGERYSAAWVGYFERLDTMEVWECIVRSSRWSSGDGPTYGFRRGH